MKTLPLILGLVAAGVIGALAATLMHPPSDGAAAPAAPREDPRVDELVNAVERLRQDVAALKVAPPLPTETPAMRAAGGPDPLDGTEDSAGVPAPAVEKLEKAVEEAVAKSRQKEMEAIGRMWTDRAARREKDMITQFAKDQGLTDYQRDEMIKLTDQRREKLAPLFRAMFTPPAEGETRDMAKIREDMQKVQDEAMTELKGLISEEQAEAYQKLEQSSRGGWGMGGGGRRSGDTNPR